MTLAELVGITGSTYGTCSVEYPRSKCVTFVRNAKYLAKLIEKLRTLPEVSEIIVVVPEEIVLTEQVDQIVAMYRTKYVDYEFTRYHNAWWTSREPVVNAPAGCKIHPTAVIDEGIRVANGPNGAKMQLKHVGGVVFGTDVYIGPLTLVERGCIDSTVIGNNVKIDGRCCVGHNSVIGDNTVMATGATVGGSAKIGKDCWLGLDCTIRNGVSICDKVIVGMRAGVVKDITESGIYMGTPAKYHGPYIDGWNF